MKAEELIAYISHPEKIGENELQGLYSLVTRYPYFQAARIVYLKALFLQSATRFREELKTATVHITDHRQLFRFLNHQIEFDFQTPRIPGMETLCSDIQPEEEPTTSKEASYEENLESMAAGGHSQASPAPLTLEVELDAPEDRISSGISFSSAPEFTAYPYILEEETTGKTPMAPENAEAKKKKNDLIDRFIQLEPALPKITADTTDTRDLSKENPIAQEELFSETLAKIYIKQQLYEKAIATYIKLSLKYPEKSIYFANRIEEIKEKIKNNQ